MTERRHPVECGIPVRSPQHVNLFPGIGADGKPCVLASLACALPDTGVSFLRIDPVTGESRRFDWPAAYGGGGPMLWSARWNRLFCYSGQSMTEPGLLLEFDPASGNVVSHGRAHPGELLIPVSLDEATDGTLYLGSLRRGCMLSSYRPDTGQWRQFGVMAPDEFYFYVKCGADGSVAGLVKMARPHVRVVDPVSGEHRAVGPVADTDAQRGRVELVKGGDGLLYIDSHEGLFRVRGMDIEPVTSYPEADPLTRLADGASVRFIDNRVINRTLEVAAPGGARRVLRLDYEAPPAGIYLVRPGPDRKVYGSSVCPLHFFSHDPATGTSVDHGQASTSSGEIYSMDGLNGKLYFCSYTHAILGEYDPASPYTFSAEVPGRPGEFRSGGYFGHYGFRYGADDNPRQLGRMDPVAYRPRDMCAGPAGKVWVASAPDYGMLGGTLSWYDPARGMFGGAHRGTIPDCSPISLAFIPDGNLLAVGFAIHGGSGTVPRASKAGFALWDPDADRPGWAGDLGEPIIGVMDLEFAGDGLVYAIVHPAPESVLRAELLLLDLPGRRIVSRACLSDAAGWPLEVSFQRADRFVYGATRDAVYRVPLGTTDIEVLWSDPGDGPTVGGALAGGRYYFATHARLRAVDVE